MLWQARGFGIAVTMVSAVAAAEIQEKDVVLLPIKTLRAVVTDGEQVFISENGRFIIKGDLYDVWQKKRITDFGEMQKLATHIDLKKIGLDVAALNTVSMGTGAEDVVVFVAPHCPACKALIQEAKKFSAKYRFQFVFLSGDEAVQKTIKNIVGAAAPDIALEAVVSNKAEDLPKITNCDPQRNAMTVLMAQLMGIDKVPFFIAPDGRLHEGLPQNLSAWLEGKH